MSTPSLQRLEEFQSLLADYRPSDKTIEVLSSMPLVILLGVSGSGRNTIINHLVQMDEYHFILSDTTRPPKIRNGRMEEDGVQYYFRSEDEVLQDIRSGAFVEAEIIHQQQVSGINSRVLIDAKHSGKIPINEVDVGGTVALKQWKPDTNFFFVIPPSMKEWMYRLRGREVMSDEELHNRLLTAQKVLQAGLENEYFTFILNDSSYESSRHIDAEVKTGERDTKAHLHARSVAEQLAKELESFLSDM